MSTWAPRSARSGRSRHGSRGCVTRGQGPSEGARAALDAKGKVVRKKGVTDGPYAETKDIVLGFIIVEARDLAEAAELARGCPMVVGDGVVEVRPVDPLRAVER